MKLVTVAFTMAFIVAGSGIITDAVAAGASKRSMPLLYGIAAVDTADGLENSDEGTKRLDAVKNKVENDFTRQKNAVNKLYAGYKVKMDVLMSKRKKDLNNLPKKPDFVLKSQKVSENEQRKQINELQAKKTAIITRDQPEIDRLMTEYKTAIKSILSNPS